MDEFPEDDFSQKSDEDKTPPRTERKSRARQRYEQRRQKTPPTEPSLSMRRERTPQVAPSSPVRRLPIQLKQWSPVAYLIGAAALVIGVIILMGLLRGGGSEEEDYPNAIWLGTEWTYQNPGADAIAALAARLRANRIGTVYAWVSWLQEDNTWGGLRSSTDEFSEMAPNVQTFVQQFNAVFPEATLYGWVSLNTSLDSDGYRMDDAGVRQSYADFAAETVTNLGFDGVFLNVEPVWNHNADDFINLLRQVRLALGDTAPIAVAIPPDWSPITVENGALNLPVPPLIAPGTEWDKAFKQRVALLTNQMAVMAYNSGLSSPVDYSEWVAYQVETYARALDEIGGTGAQIIIGLPTYDNELPAHDTRVENVESALNGIRRGLELAGSAADHIQGVAIYAEWTTSNEEWDAFTQGWIR